jgi:formylglycine-generating enzyme required for sulfatase activity
LPKNQAPGHEEESLDKIIEDILKAVASEKRSGMAPVSIGQSTINNTRLVVMPLKPYNDWAVAVSEHPVTNKQYANFLKNVKSDLLDEIIHNHVSQKIHVDYLKSNFQKPCGKLMEEGRENDIFYPDTDERFNHRDNPVVCVSLIEALGYVSWLNSELNFTGYIFTLVSPALWRFAAFGRPGNNTYTVDTITQQHLVHKAAHPSPVSRKGERSNALGLSDMFGNVWEWCEPDVAERDDDETDGTAPGHKKTTAEIAGGGYLYDLEHISPFLSSEMLENEIFTRRSDLGFRIAALVNTKNMGPKEKEQLNAVEADATQYVEQYFNRNYKYY